MDSRFRRPPPLEFEPKILMKKLNIGLVGYGFMGGQHVFYVLCFPSADMLWRADKGTMQKSPLSGRYLN